MILRLAQIVFGLGCLTAVVGALLGVWETDGMEIGGKLFMSGGIVVFAGGMACAAILDKRDRDAKK